MHANCLLDPLLYEYVAAHQQKLLDGAPVTLLRGTSVPRRGRGASGEAGPLGVEPEAADAPEKLRAA